MLNFIDTFLNKITMYRLVLYYLIVLIVVACIGYFFHVVSYDPVQIILSTLFLVFFSAFVNEVFAKVWGAPPNTESVYITALILALIVTPASSLTDFVTLAWVAGLAMASKYMFAIRYRHIFNPAAIAVVLTAYGFLQSASWWIGNAALLPFVIIGGLLIVRKTKKEDMVFIYIITAVLVTVGFTLLRNGSPISVVEKVLFHSSLFFFGFVMLTEPLTMPGTRTWQLVYGAFVGFLFVPSVHLAGIYSTPELALCIANVFAYIVGSKEKIMLHLKEKIQLSSDTFDFVFPLQKKIAFVPGQYMEWTLPHSHVDDRGNRRYFTIASSPTENNLRIGVKFYDPSSSYKTQMLAMNETTPMIVAGRGGDFTLPADTTKKLVFMAGGIGITPFRSILKYLVDTNQKRDIVLVYSNKKKEEIVYGDVIEEAIRKIGLKVIFTLTDVNAISASWKEKRGRVDATMIKDAIPDYAERLFYLSGPHAMVTGFENTLRSMSIPPSHIKTDFFPGFV